MVHGVGTLVSLDYSALGETGVSFRANQGVPFAMRISAEELLQAAPLEAAAYQLISKVLFLK